MQLFSLLQNEMSNLNKTFDIDKLHRLLAKYNI